MVPYQCSDLNSSCKFANACRSGPIRVTAGSTYAFGRRHDRDICKEQFDLKLFSSANMNVFHQALALLLDYDSYV